MKEVKKAHLVSRVHKLNPLMGEVTIVVASREVTGSGEEREGRKGP